MAYETKCRNCYGRGTLCTWQNMVEHTCPRCEGTGHEKPYRRTPDQGDVRKLGWKLIHAWPKYGPAGHCQCCGKALTGRRKTRCGDRECDNLIWRRLYDGIHWMKRHIVVRDGCACRACGQVFESPLVPGGPVYPEPRRLELDHIVPLIDGGTDLPENLQLLCPACHAAKSADENKQRPFGKKAAGGLFASGGPRLCNAGKEAQ